MKTLPINEELQLHQMAIDGLMKVIEQMNQRIVEIAQLFEMQAELNKAYKADIVALNRRIAKIEELFSAKNEVDILKYVGELPAGAESMLKKAME